jgi:DMSO/TMAO reductase YedYZ molybdopterin-dependent catalytic subunit
MAFVSRGFRGRRTADVDPARVPPGQYVTRDFPVLSAGPTPQTSLELWDFSIAGELDEPRRWTWEEFRALPSEEITRDIHCVTKWSKLDTLWQGVSVDTLLEGIQTAAAYVTAYSDGGYTTNLPLEDVTGGKAWVVFAYEGQPLEPEHGGPARMLVPPAERPRSYACGPTPFVEAVAEALVQLGHDPQAIKTERFGPTGR